MLKGEKAFYFFIFLAVIFLLAFQTYSYSFFLLFTAVFCVKKINNISLTLDAAGLKKTFFFLTAAAAFILLNYKKSLDTERFFYEIALYLFFILYGLCFFSFKNKDKINFLTGLNYAVTACAAIALGYYFKNNTARLNFPVSNPNVFADVIFLPLLYSFFYFKKNIYFKLSFIILAVSFILCFSKGAFLGMGVIILGAAVLKLNKQTRKKVFFMFFILILIITAVFYYNLKTDPFSFSRPAIYLNSLSIFTSNFYAGTGVGNFREYFTLTRISEKYSTGRYQKIASNAHNEFLHIAVENGFFLSGLFFALIAAVLILNYKNQKKGVNFIILLYFTYLIITLSVSVNLHNWFMIFLFCFTFTSCFNNLLNVRLKSGFFTRYKMLTGLTLTMILIYFSVSLFVHVYYLKKAHKYHILSKPTAAVENYAYAYRAFKFSLSPLTYTAAIYFDIYSQTKDERALDTAFAYTMGALSRHPLSSYPLNLKSRYFYLKGDYNRSLYYLQKAVKNDPYLVSNYFKKYEVLKNINHPSAEIYLKKSLFIEPFYLPSHKELKAAGKITDDEYKTIEKYIKFYYNTLKKDSWSKPYIERLIKG